MAGFNYAQNIIGLKKGSGDIHELELEVAQLSASILSINGEIEDLSDWGEGEKLYEDTSMTVMGYVNTKLNLAYIKINGHDASPSSTTLSVEINNKYRPITNEAYNRGRYECEFTVSYDIGTNKTTFNISFLNTSYQWYNGAIVYVIAP